MTGENYGLFYKLPMVFFLCSDIPFEQTGFSRLYKKVGIAFIVDKSNSVESF